MSGAVCVLIYDENQGEILSCSRKNDHTAWGLPGGKIDPGEQPVQAAMRELKEETGFFTDYLEVCYAAIADEHIGVCVCYRAPNMAWFVRAIGIKQIPQEGLVAWKTPTDLANGPFGEYNRAMFEELGIPYDESSTTVQKCS